MLALLCISEAVSFHPSSLSHVAFFDTPVTTARGRPDQQHEFVP